MIYNITRLAILPSGKIPSEEQYEQSQRGVFHND